MNSTNHRKMIYQRGWAPLEKWWSFRLDSILTYLRFTSFHLSYIFQKQIMHLTYNCKIIYAENIISIYTPTYQSHEVHTIQHIHKISIFCTYGTIFPQNRRKELLYFSGILRRILCVDIVTHNLNSFVENVKKSKTCFVSCRVPRAACRVWRNILFRKRIPSKVRPVPVPVPVIQGIKGSKFAF